MKNKIILSLIFGVLYACGVNAQSLNRVKPDSLFAIISDNNKGMMSVAISKNDSVLYQKAIGFASINDQGKVPATIHTRYRVGSISKTFTAVMIFQLIEKGKLSLNDPLAKYFSTIPNADKITVSNLLNHRSGIYNFTNDPAYLQYMTQPKSQTEMVEIIAKNKSDFEPGTKFEYSNSNYVLLGYIIEKITGKTYSENLDQRIVKKLNLKETYIGTKTDLKKSESYSYRLNGVWIQQPETDLSTVAGAGAVTSTPTELNIFITALFKNKLVSPTSLTLMKTLTEGYGMGLFQVPFGQKKGYGHNGIIDGFVSNVFYFPEDDLAVSICSNGVSYPLNDVLIAMLNSYYQVPFTLPSFKTIALKPEELDIYPGIYSSTMLPIKITVTKTTNGLIAQATGQGPFPLSASEKDIFKYDGAGIIMAFDPSKNEFILKQGGRNFLFTKEK